MNIATKLKPEINYHPNLQTAYTGSVFEKCGSEANAIDVPGALLRQVAEKRFRAEIVSTEGAVIVGVEELAAAAETLELEIVIHVTSGMDIAAGQVVAAVTGDPLQIVRGEDKLLSLIGKASGVATAARRAVQNAGRIKVVCGGWKKIPSAVKQLLRSAVMAGGAKVRMLSEPFVYLDKNYIRIIGSLSKAVQVAKTLPDRAMVVQLRGETAPIGQEAIIAAGYGAKIVMVDTGDIADVRRVSENLRQAGLRENVKIAFAGGVLLGDLENLQQEDVDVVDIGRAILDAPLTDFRYDVVVTDS